MELYDLGLIISVHASTLDYLMHDPPNLVYLIYLKYWALDFKFWCIYEYDVFNKYNVHLGVICPYIKLYLRKINKIKVWQIINIYDFCNFSC
jgi:hypothetical protein